MQGGRNVCGEGGPAVYIVTAAVQCLCFESEMVLVYLNIIISYCKFQCKAKFSNNPTVRTLPVVLDVFVIPMVGPCKTHGTFVG